MTYCPDCGYPHGHESKYSKKHGHYYICGFCKQKFKSGELL